MRIESLHIENFRRLKRVELELPDGVTALVGRNGAGKSTLLEAIGWCLYGNDAARTEKDLIKRRGAGPNDDVRVRLAFRFGDHTYEVTRELVGKKEEHVATVIADGKVVVPAGARSQLEATSYIGRLFHMDREAFFTSLVARQRELAALTDAKPADRKRVLVSLLRLDAVDDAIRIARERKRDAKARLGGMRAAALDVGALHKQLDAARAALAGDAAALAAAQVRVATLETEVEDVRARREASRKVQTEFQIASFDAKRAAERRTMVVAERERRVQDLAAADAAGAEAAALAPQLDGLVAARRRLDHLTALRERHQELGRIQQELTAATAERARAEAELASATGGTTGRATLETLAQRVAAERTRLDTLLVDAQTRAATAAAQMVLHERSIKEVAEKEARIRAMGPESPCPTCTRPLHEHHGQLLHGFAEETRAHRDALAATTLTMQEARAATEAHRKSFGDLFARQQEIQTKLRAIAQEDARVEGARRAAAESGARIERLAERAKAFEAEPFDPQALLAAQVDVRRLDALREKFARVAALADRAPDLRALVESSALAEEAARAAQEQAAARCAALGFDVAAHEALEKAADDSARRLADARESRIKLEAERRRRADEERRLVEELAKQEELAREIAALEARVRLLEQLGGDTHAGGLLPDFKDHLVGRIRPLLTAHAGRLFRDLTDGRYADLEVADDYELNVHDDGKAFGLARFSGGESDLANLCLRLAVSQVVAERAGTEGFGFLALDEVFGSQDEVRKGNILRALKGLSGRFRQIVLITHVDDVKEMAEHVLRVTENEDGTSSITLEA